MVVRLLFDLLELKKNLRLDPLDLEKLQRKRLKAIVKHAYESVPFYHKKLTAAGVKPNDIQYPADLVKLPITTKQEIQACSRKEVVANNVDIHRCVKRSTSGSTGLPLTVFVDNSAAENDGAIWARTFLEAGLRPWDKMAIISDPRSFPCQRSWVHRFRVMNRRYISIFDDAENQFSLLREYQPHVIKGYPSSLAIIAHSCKNDPQVKPRLVLTSAELLDNESRNLIRAFFEADVLDNYACNEFGLLAWECSVKAGYHINVDGTLMEFAENGIPVAPGESGEILCTTLTNRAMPLLRYKLGDIGVPIEEKCPCGRSLPLMRLIEGRLDDFLVTLDNRIISPTIFYPYPFESLQGIKQFRVIQETKDRLKIQLAVSESFLDGEFILEKARARIKNLFGDQMQVEFEILESLERDQNGKLRKVISHVPLNLDTLHSHTGA